MVSRMVYRELSLIKFFPRSLRFLDLFFLFLFFFFFLFFLFLFRTSAVGKNSVRDNLQVERASDLVDHPPELDGRLESVTPSNHLGILLFPYASATSFAWD